MLDLDAAQWGVVFGAISSLVVLVGAAMGIRQLRIVAKTSRLQAYDFFICSWRETRDSRLYVLENFAFDSGAPPDVETPEGEHLRRVINNLSEIGFLVEKRILPAEYVMSMVYADLIRLDHRLQPYLDYRSGQLGITYGRRVGQLGAQARRWMGRQPELRYGTIRNRIPATQNYEDVYHPSVTGADRLPLFFGHLLHR
jgi:hypothetical protein